MIALMGRNEHTCLHAWLAGNIFQREKEQQQMDRIDHPTNSRVSVFRYFSHCTSFSPLFLSWLGEDREIIDGDHPNNERKFIALID